MFDDPAPLVSRREGVLAIAVGLACVMLLVWTARLPEAGTEWRIAFVSGHLFASGMLYLWLRRRTPGLRLVLLGAVLLRVVAFPMAPVLSDDAYRYLWDGQLVVSGVSPYAMKPSDPSLTPRKDRELLDRMNSPDYYSVYPPASQAVFAAAALTGDWRHQWLWLKVLLVCAELVGIWVLMRVCGTRAGAFYAWSPLAVIEIAGQGHTEGIVIGGLSLVLLAGRARWPLASIGMTVAGLTKLYPFALAPAVWRRDGIAGVSASALLTLGLGALVWHPQAIVHARESLALFFGTFDEYAAPYRMLKAAFYPFAESGAGAAASSLLAGLFALGMGLAALVDDGRRTSLMVALAACVVGFALAASTLHPWYWVPVLWMSPLLMTRSICWIAVLSSTTYLSYTVPGFDTWAIALGWGGGALILLTELYRGRSSASAANSESALTVRASSQRAPG